MKNIVCCGFGHRLIFSNIQEELYRTLERLICEENVRTFLVGEQGEFDALFAKTVLRLKEKHSGLRLFLILPYFSNRLNENKSLYEKKYDEVIIPEAVEGRHYKNASVFKNRWMIDQSDVIISYVHRDFGGAFSAVSYAKRKNKRIISL